MSEKKTLGQIRSEAFNKTFAETQQWHEAEAAGIAAVCRAVMAEQAKASIDDRPDVAKWKTDVYGKLISEPPKPEAASEAGEDYDRAAGRRILGNVDANGVLRLSIGECAAIIREAAERHYGPMLKRFDNAITDLSLNLSHRTKERDAAVARVTELEASSRVEHAKRLADQLDAMEKERDAARAECERLKAALKLAESKCNWTLEVGPNMTPVAVVKSAATPAPPANAGEDLIDAVEVGIDGWVKREYLAQCRMSVLEQIQPRFDAVRAERDEAKKLHAKECREHRASIEYHSKFRNRIDKALWEPRYADSDMCTALCLRIDELRQRAEAAESELAKRPDERSCLAALMKISETLGLGGIVNPSDTVKAVEAMKAERDAWKANYESMVGERDRITAELREVREAMKWSLENTAVGWSVKNSEWEVWQSGMMIAKAKDRTDAILAAYRSTKGKE